jgi:peptidyl-prolyl cis-trans isomerase C
MVRSRSRFFILLFIALHGCTSGFRQEEPIARVNGSIVTVHDFRALFDILKPKELAQGTKENSELKNLILKTLVRRTVILTEAKRKNISVSDNELDAAIEKYKQGYTPEVFRENLLEQMVDEKEWREQIRQNLLIAKIFDSTEVARPVPKPEEALSFYEKNSALFHSPARAVALHLVLADKAKAEELRKNIASRPTTFLEVAKKYSIGPEAQEDAKIRIDRGALPPELDKALFELPIGAISPVIQSSYGFHVLKVLERTSEINKDFEQAKGEIMKHLLSEGRLQTLSHFEEELIRSAQIEYNRELIRKL